MNPLSSTSQTGNPDHTIYGIVGLAIFGIVYFIYRKYRKITKGESGYHNDNLYGALFSVSFLISTVYKFWPNVNPTLTNVIWVFFGSILGLFNLVAIIQHVKTKL